MALIDRIKYVVWDWNGTLLDDAALCTDIMNVLLRKYGLEEITLKSYRRVFDFPVKDYYSALGFDFDKIPFEVVGQEFIDIYNTERKNMRLHTGAEQLLEYFDQKGVKQAIISARNHHRLEEDLEFFGIKKYFDNIIGLDDDLARGKAHLTADFVKGLNEQGYTGDQLLFIGDTVHDCEIGKANKGHVLLVANGHHAPERLLMCSDFVFANLTNLKNFLEI